MLRLSKKIEYAMLALQYITNKKDELATAKEISESLGIPYEFLSKSLQALNKKGILESQQGTKGGYLLSRSADKISVDEIIRALDEKQGIVECVAGKTEDQCDRMDVCTIKDPMVNLQHQINSIFMKTTLAQLADNKAE